MLATNWILETLSPEDIPLTCLITEVQKTLEESCKYNLESFTAEHSSDKHMGCMLAVSLVIYTQIK